MDQQELPIEMKKHNISIREMPVELWRSFRKHCIDRGLTVEDEVLNALNEYLVNHSTDKETSDVAQ